MEYLTKNIDNAVHFTVLIIVIIIVVTSIYLLHRFRIMRYIYKQPVKYIEVVPPLRFEKTPEAMAQLFTLLYSISSARKLRDRILLRPVILSPEIVSTRKHGVRYVIRSGVKEYETVRREITAFMPDGRINDIDDPLINSAHSIIRDYRQTKHFAFALRTFPSFDQHDPIADITGQMNRLKDGEQIALQLVITPINVRNMKDVVHKFHEYSGVSDITHNKGYSKLFRTDLRVRISADTNESIEGLRIGLDTALQAFSIERIQSLKARYNFLRNKYRELSFKHRLPAPFPRLSNIFSSLELANMYHFPAGQTNTENLNRSVSRTLAPPLSIRNNQSFDFVLGETNHHGEKQLVGLTKKEREKHVYIIGGTGNGKTTMMQNAIVNDIVGGEGVAVIDPHGDMAEELLRHIPEERLKDVIYFNPKDLDNPIGFNPLEIPEELTGTALLDERERVCEALVSTLRKVFSDDDTGGSRIEAMLRNAIHTAFEAKNPTLFTIYDLINDDQFRNKVVAKLGNEHLKKFWINEFGKAGGMQQVKIAFGVTTKIGRFLFSESAKRVFGQPKSTINFSTIMDEGKILICNFSKGRLGDDTSSLFGIVTLAQLQLAALKRAELKKKDRRPFYLYVDEFQNFATPSFEQILSQVRKYHMHMIMAEQSTQQQDSRMIGVMLNNVGTVVVFRSGNPVDEATLLPLFYPYLERGEMMNLPTFNFYARLTAVDAQEPVSGTTIVIEDEGSDEVAERVVESSRRQYTGETPVITPSRALRATKRPNTTNSPSTQDDDTQDGQEQGSLLSPEER